MNWTLNFKGKLRGDVKNQEFLVNWYSLKSSEFSRLDDGRENDEVNFISIPGSGLYGKCHYIDRLKRRDDRYRLATIYPDEIFTYNKYGEKSLLVVGEVDPRNFKELSQFILTHELGHAITGFHSSFGRRTYNERLCDSLYVELFDDIVGPIDFFRQCENSEEIKDRESSIIEYYKRGFLTNDKGQRTSGWRDYLIK